MDLDALTPVFATVGYGELGLRGDLGYEGKRVTVRGKAATSAISTHAPARVMFRLDGGYRSLRAHVALNDDVPVDRSRAHFTVLADGKEIAYEAGVTAGEPAREVLADVTGADLLELCVTTDRWEYCHSIWVHPRLELSTVPAPPGVITDCLGRAEVQLPRPVPKSRHAVLTVASRGFDRLLDDLLGSLAANGRVPEALLVVFLLGDDPRSLEVARKHGAVVVRCRPLTAVNAASKGVLYSAARILDVDAFVCLDADMLVVDDLRPLFAAIEAGASGSIFACREANSRTYTSLGQALETVYRGQRTDLQKLLTTINGEGEYPLVVNDGTFAAGREAMLDLDRTIRAFPQAAHWVDERRDVWWRNQFVFNLALARLQCGVELDPACNLQLNYQDVTLSQHGSRVLARWQAKPVRVLHFNGVGRHKYPEWRNLYGKVDQPIPRSSAEDSYGEFLAALRTWIGRHGVGALAWSVYGTVSGDSIKMTDAGTMPLLGCLHYLVRSNGYSRVLETGTARGVSAACFASAVAHRPDGRVVTYDPVEYPERADLWLTLPAAMREVIEPRVGDCLSGMEASIEAGETYDVAFLDSLHTADHVWAEFRLACRLIRPGCLILIHDAICSQGSVADALVRIRKAGYGVTHLWTGSRSALESDALGLAVIENRGRFTPKAS
jgi:predicted O-methyltransferase YrrM